MRDAVTEEPQGLLLDHDCPYGHGIPKHHAGRACVNRKVLELSRKYYRHASKNSRHRQVMITQVLESMGGGRIKRKDRVSGMWYPVGTKQERKIVANLFSEKRPERLLRQRLRRAVPEAVGHDQLLSDDSAGGATVDEEEDYQSANLPSNQFTVLSTDPLPAAIDDGEPLDWEVLSFASAEDASSPYSNEVATDQAILHGRDLVNIFDVGSSDADAEHGEAQDMQGLLRDNDSPLEFNDSLPVDNGLWMERTAAWIRDLQSFRVDSIMLRCSVCERSFQVSGLDQGVECPHCSKKSDNSDDTDDPDDDQDDFDGHGGHNGSSDKGDDKSDDPLSDEGNDDGDYGSGGLDSDQYEFDFELFSSLSCRLQDNLVEKDDAAAISSAGTTVQAAVASAKTVSSNADAQNLKKIAKDVAQLVASSDYKDEMTTAVFKSGPNLEANVQRLEQDGDIKAAVLMMQQHLQDSTLQAQLCAALVRLASGRVNQGMIKEVGGIEAIVAAMQRHLTHARLQAHGCQALGNLSFENLHVRQAVAAAGGIDAILAALAAYQECAGVQHYGCRALGNLAWSNRKECAAGIDFVIAALQRHQDDVFVQAYGCFALESIAFNSRANTMEICLVGGIELVVAAMHHHESDGLVQEKACRALWSFTFGDTNNNKAIADAGGIECIMAAMRQHGQDATIQRNACLALGSLASGAGDSGDVARSIVEAGGEGLVVAAMEQHEHDSNVQTSGYDVLSSLENHAAALRHHATDEVQQSVDDDISSSIAALNLE